MAAAAPAAVAAPTQAQLNKWCADAYAGAHTAFEAPASAAAAPTGPTAFGQYHSGSGFVVNEKGRWVVARTNGAKPFGLVRVDDAAPEWEGKPGLPPIFYAIVAGHEDLVDLLVARAPYGTYYHDHCKHMVYHTDTRDWHEYAPAHVASDCGKFAMGLRLDLWTEPTDVDVHCAAAWYGRLQHFQAMGAGHKKQLNGVGGVDGQKLVWHSATKRYGLAKLATYKGPDCDREPVFFAAAAGHTAIVQWFAAQDGVAGQTTTYAKPIHAVVSDGHGGYTLVGGGSGSATPDGSGGAAGGSGGKKKAGDGKSGDDEAVRVVTPAEVAKANAHADTAHALEGGNRNCQACSASDCVVS